MEAEFNPNRVPPPKKRHRGMYLQSKQRGGAETGRFLVLTGKPEQQNGQAPGAVRKSALKIKDGGASEEDK